MTILYSYNLSEYAEKRLGDEIVSISRIQLRANMEFIMDEEDLRTFQDKIEDF